MMKEMKAVVYEKPGRENAGLKEVPYPVCGEDDVIVKVVASGICKGADGDHDRNGTPQAKYPVTPGHEFAGITEEIGSGVTWLKKGQRVTADPYHYCGTCCSCREGRPEYCENSHYIGHDINGSFAEYILVRADKIYVLPESVSFEQATFAEPLACCMHCIKRAAPAFGETALVLGSGCSGLLMAELLSHIAGRVFCIAGTKAKLDILKPFAVTTILSERGKPGVHEEAFKSYCPYGVDIVIDTTGSPDMIKSGIGMLKKGGRFVQYGLVREPFEADIMRLWADEKTYLTSCCECNDFQAALEALEKGMVDVDPLITSRFSLDEYFKGLDVALNDRANIKTIIAPSP